jgi:hypothetical protein
MTRLMSAAAAAALIGLLASGALLRADEDCDTVVKSLNEALQIALNNYKATLDELKNKPAVRKAFCSASGEYIGTARVFRVVAAECRKGDLVELDKAIKGLDDLVDNTCK